MVTPYANLERLIISQVGACVHSLAFAKDVLYHQLRLAKIASRTHVE